MSGWNQAPYPRDHILLFRETLGDRIPDHHSVRLFAEILDGIDWSRWERHYVLVAGQAPIHPRIMAGAILCGLTYGIRSSRRLEWACGNAVDFLWLVEGRTIDHSTFCDFRTKFQRELTDLFRQIGRVAMHRGLIRLNQVAFDGTRLKANRPTVGICANQAAARDTGEASAYRVYQCESCEGCGLASVCLDGQSRRRTGSHDQHEAVRREVALRLKTESGKKTYAQRAHLAETPNGFIKEVLGLRQFLLRGLGKVRTEWLWACTVFNLRKLMIAREKLRADASLEAV